MSRVTLAVYNRAGTLVAEPAKWWVEGGLFLDELDDIGACTINVQADDTDLGDIQPGMILVVSLDATAIWRGVLRRRVDRVVADTEAGEYVTVSGTGEAGRLDELVVYPTGGLGRFPFSDERTFNWTAPEYDDSGWDAVVVTAANYGETNENYGLPEGFPDGTSEWIWNVDSSGSVPAGIKRFRKTTTAASTAVREAWSAADDRNEVWFQGTSILKSSDAPYDGRTTAVELLVSSGSLTVAAQAENRNALKAGFLFSLLVPLETSSTVVKTDSTWKVAPDSAELGMTAGKILKVLFDEAVARGETVPSYTFTAALDSAGNAWTVYDEVTVPVGSATYLDVLRQLVDLEMCDFRMDPAGYTLKLYNPGAAGSEVDYTLGDGNLRSLTWDESAAVSSALLVRWQRGYTDQADSGLVTEHGRRVSFLALGGVASESTAESQASLAIKQFGKDRAEVSADIEPEDTASEPYTKYEPGDSIYAITPTAASGYNDGFYNDGNYNEDTGTSGLSAQRVMAVGMGVDDTGQPMWSIHLNSTIAEMAKRQQVMLRRLANGSIGGRSQTSTVPYQPRPVEPREPQPVIFSQHGVVASATSGPHTFTRAVRIREVQVELGVADSGSSDVVLTARKGGVTFATVTVSSGRVSSYEPVSNVVFQQRSQVLTLEWTYGGTTAENLTAKVIYA